MIRTMWSRGWGEGTLLALDRPGTNAATRFRGKTMNQAELIELHEQLTSDATAADDYRLGHYEHVLYALRRLIESHGPTEAYREWSEAAFPGQSPRFVCATN
jgi:hypothetical protein